MILQTDGSGLWSGQCKNVKIDSIELDWEEGDDGIPELLVIFDTDTWNVKELGLIYTDKLFKRQLQEFLKECGFLDADTISYSEQGMQGKDFVSLDTSDEFAREYDQKIVDEMLKRRANDE